MQSVKKTNLKCPNCDSVKLRVQSKRCICRDCGAVFKPFKPYRGRFRKHPEILKKKVVSLYSDGYSVTQIRQMLNIEHVRKEVINRWLRKRGLKARPKPRLLDVQCPACHIKGQSVKDGYLQNRFGLKTRQRFLCRNCGSFFTLKGLIGIPKYSEAIKEEAISYYLSDVNLSLRDTKNHLGIKFNVKPDETTIYGWLIKHGIKPRGHMGNQYTRTKKLFEPKEKLQRGEVQHG